MKDRYNNPQPLSPQEWQEIAGHPTIQEMWGFDAEHGPAEARQPFCYGTKFDFISDSPGYSGDLFVLVGAGLSAHPVVVCRNSVSKQLDILDF